MADTKQERKELAKRLENPSKEFDSLLWRPKSRLLRRFKAKYISYVIFAGYAFFAVLAGITVYVWAWPNPIFVEGEGTPKLEPLVEKVISPGPGVLENVQVDNGRVVTKGARLAEIRSANGARSTVTAPIDGIAYIGSNNMDSTVIQGARVDSGSTIFRVVDFTRLAINGVKVKKKAYDSVNIGDSANVTIQGNTLTDLNLSFALSVDDERVYGRVGYGIDNALMKELANAMKGDSITANDFTAFPFEDLEEVKLTYFGEGAQVAEGAESGYKAVGITGDKRQSDETSGQIGFVLNRRKGGTPIRGVVDGGHRILKIKKVKEYKPEVREAIMRFVDRRVKGNLIAAEGKAYRLTGNPDDYLMEVTMTGKIPLDVYERIREGKKKKKGGLSSSGTRTADFMIADLTVRNPPQWVSDQARVLYEMPESARLVCKVEINSFTTTWGAKIRKRL
ncbi:MAG: hypothetical protein GF344_13565 [Chitinivibrionales bacterium]|nr:hypothetical protein [Chitinivibrionales bacterium]MBD3357759.1 hypothetical protein [Chitinivibrionales bacterium]